MKYYRNNYFYPLIFFDALIMKQESIPVGCAPLAFPFQGVFSNPQDTPPRCRLLYTFDEESPRQTPLDTDPPGCRPPCRQTHPDADTPPPPYMYTPSRQTHRSQTFHDADLPMHTSPWVQTTLCRLPKMQNTWIQTLGGRSSYRQTT